MVKRGGHYQNEHHEGARSHKRARVASSSTSEFPPGTSVYVGNLSFETSWQNLKDHMRLAGNVNTAKIWETPAGKSKGCGIVLYQTPREAQRAIRELHDSTLDGRKLMVREDRDAERKETTTSTTFSSNSNSRDAAAAASGANKGSSVFVGNLSFDTSWQDLKDLCRNHGKVDRVEVMEKDGRKKGYGIVTFATSQDAAHAIRKLDGMDFQGRQLDVKMERKRGDDQTSAAAIAVDSSSSSSACQLYVGNLSYECSWQDLKDLCRKHGLPVDRAEVIEKDGRKKGFGIITLGNARDAEMAIRKLKGVEFQGRTLEVRLDHKSGYTTPNPSSAAMATSSGGGARGKDDDCRLFVGNLSFECSWQDLKDHFRKCGRVEHAEVIEGADGRKRGFGIVTFANPSETAMAIERLDDVEFQGRRLEVRLDRKSSEPGFKAGPPKETYRKSEAGFKAGPRKEAYVKKNKVEKSEPEPYDHQAALGGALKSSR